MGKESIKKESGEINEEYLMSIMAEGIQKDGLSVPLVSEEKRDVEKTTHKERGRSKKNQEVDYEVFFFRRAESSARNGKSVYIRPDFHERLSRIVQVIGEDKITIYAYLNHVLEFHFQEFGDDITRHFNDKYKPIL